jgi:RNA polymerase sigma factor (TIGR02999 family)
MEGDLTLLIRRAQQGDRQALDALFEASYLELRRIARARLRGDRGGQTLDTTSLVHESYLRFVEAGRLEIHDRAHFLGYAGQAMRSIIIDLVRSHRAARHGGDAVRVTLNTGLDAGVAGEDEILRVHEALDVLAKRDARMAKVVEMRYFGGLTEAEIAEALGVTERTVRRDWEKARLWLAEALE